MMCIEMDSMKDSLYKFVPGPLFLIVGGFIFYMNGCMEEFLGFCLD